MDDGFGKLDISNNNNSKFGSATTTTTSSNDFANFDVFSNISQNFKSHGLATTDSWKRGATKKTVASSGFGDDFHCPKRAPICRPSSPKTTRGTTISERIWKRCWSGRNSRNKQVRS
nr:uncharacterized protein LOC115253946 [Aedes albopictus]